MAIHVFDRQFLDRLTREKTSLPLNLSEKKVPSLDDDGEGISPETPNAYKFERFIFDALPLAIKTLVVEADRAKEFSPVKNATGTDTPESAKAAMTALHRGWLRSAGAIVDEDAPVEISPLFALDERELKEKIPAGKEYKGSVYLQ
jgi:UDP-N-acetylglucosamine/UDP-N-acetylgalactosamine diphosphorylase